MISARRRQEILDALRRGTVPGRGLDQLAVGLSRFAAAVDEELDTVERGGSVFKAIRGEYGCGKTFFARWLAERARARGWATSEVQISENETPLHRLETVYRRLMERLCTPDVSDGALRSVVESWFYALEEDVLAQGEAREQDEQALLARTTELMEQRLGEIHRKTPAFSAALRAYRQATARQRPDIAEGLLSWLGAQPNVGGEVKRFAGLKGDVDHFAALGFLQGLLAVLKDSGRPGLLVVLDEVETLQRVRSDVRDRSYNALRQLVDEIDGGRFPGLYLMVTGTPAFYDGPQGISRLPPLAQRLHVGFDADTRFDNPRAVQIRLPAFRMESLEEVGRRVRDLYAEQSPQAGRVRALADDALLRDLASGVAGELGGRVGIAPRLFLKKLVGEVLDRIEQFPDFDPRQHYRATLADSELTLVERNARAGNDPDAVELEP